MASLAPVEISGIWSLVVALLLLILVNLASAQVVPGVNPYQSRGYGPFGRGFRPLAEPNWGRREWSSIQELSSAMRAHESRNNALNSPSVQSSTQMMTGPSPRFTANNSQGFQSGSILPNRANVDSYGSVPLMSHDPSPRPGSFDDGRPPLGTSRVSFGPGRQEIFSNVTGRPVSYRTETPRTEQPGTRININNTSAPANSIYKRIGRNGSDPYGNAAVAAISSPLGVVYKEAQTVRYTEPGNSTSSYLGISGSGPYNRPSVGAVQSRTYSNGNSAGRDAALQDSAGSYFGEAPQAETTEEHVLQQTSIAGATGGRRIMNPYDLSHIFPDIYATPDMPSYDNMTNQSLDLLEMTALNTA